MQTIADFCQLLRSGKQPVVTFKKGIDDKESYAEAHMRARVLRCSAPDGDEVLQLTFDFEEFDAHNTPLESANYYDDKGRATRTAKQAGYYKPQETLYFDLSERVDDLFTIEAEEGVALFQEYTAQAPGCSYVSWLEAQVLAARG